MNEKCSCIVLNKQKLYLELINKKKSPEQLHLNELSWKQKWKTEKGQIIRKFKLKSLYFEEEKKSNCVF